MLALQRRDLIKNSFEIVLPKMVPVLLRTEQSYRSFLVISPEGDNTGNSVLEIFKIPERGVYISLKNPSVTAGSILFHERSEEHTSELQSRGHLVCRLLLEKKKQNKQTSNS